jgi:hypothetical protein
LQLLKKKKKKKIPQKETTKEREMCGDSNRFPFLHREGGGDMSWRKCREISESEKKKRWDCVTIQTRCQENYNK